MAEMSQKWVQSLGATEASQTTYKGMTEQQSGCREINLHQQHCHQHLITAVDC